MNTPVGKSSALVGQAIASARRSRRSTPRTLGSLFDEAVARWQIALGETQNRRRLHDVHGWFIDRTPWDDSSLRRGPRLPASRKTRQICCRCSPTNSGISSDRTTITRLIQSRRRVSRPTHSPRACGGVRSAHAVSELNAQAEGDTPWASWIRSTGSRHWKRTRPR